MSETTPRLNLPLVGDHSQKHIVMNAGLMRLESLVQARALSRGVTGQPVSPQNGDSYILPASATGAIWATLAVGTLVRAESGTWEIIEFPAGGIIHIADENRLLVKTATGWAGFESVIKALDALVHVGIGTEADSYNVLAVKGAAALLSAQSLASGGTGNISLSLNKDSDGNSAQILLQKGYSSRAILGLLGDNNLTLKVSPDGSAWSTVFTVDRNSAQVSAKWGIQPPLWPMKSLLGSGGQRIAPIGAGVTSNVAVTANRLYMLPVIIPYDISIVAMGVRITTGASGNVRLGLYQDNQGHPGTLLYEGVPISTSATGLSEVSLSQSLSAGVYWLAAVFNAAPTVNSHTGAAMGRDSLSATSAPISGYFRAFTYGVLPVDESAQSYVASSVAMPTVMLG